MPTDVPNEGVTVNASGPMTWWNRLMFGVAGFLATLVMGRKFNRAALLAQARLETADYSSARAAGSPWCMWAGELTSRRDGVQVTTQGEQLAYYKPGLIGYYKAWKDRLEWDEKRGVEYVVEPEQYMKNVVLQGRWFGGQASTEAKANAYADAVMKHYPNVSWWVRAMSNVNLALNSSASDTIADKAKRFIIQWLFFGITLMILIWLFKVGVRRLFRSWSTPTTRRQPQRERSYKDIKRTPRLSKT